MQFTIKEIEKLKNRLILDEDSLKQLKEFQIAIEIKTMENFIEELKLKKKHQNKVCDITKINNLIKEVNNYLSKLYTIESSMK